MSASSLGMLVFMSATSADGGLDAAGIGGRSMPATVIKDMVMSSTGATCELVFDWVCQVQSWIVVLLLLVL